MYFYIKQTCTKHLNPKFDPTGDPPQKKPNRKLNVWKVIRLPPKIFHDVWLPSTPMQVSFVYPRGGLGCNSLREPRWSKGETGMFSTWITDGT